MTSAPSGTPWPDGLPGGAALRRATDALYGGLLRSPVAQERAAGVGRWAEHLGDVADLLPLLDDDAPLVRRHAGEDVLVEVRAPALVALQDRYRPTGRWPHGPVLVRRALPVAQALADAREAGLHRPDAASALVRAQQRLADVVRPPDEDADACLAYLVLAGCGLLEYRRQPVLDGVLLTPLQQEVHGSQVRSARPVPHVRFDTAADVAGGTADAGRTVGFLFHEGGWVLDVDESPQGRDVDRLVREVLRLPHVRALAEDDVAGRLAAVADVVRRLRPAVLVLDDDGPAGPAGRNRNP